MYNTKLTLLIRLFLFWYYILTYIPILEDCFKDIKWGCGIVLSPQNKEYLDICIREKIRYIIFSIYIYGSEPVTIQWKLIGYGLKRLRLCLDNFIRNSRLSFNCDELVLPWKYFAATLLLLSMLTASAVKLTFLSITFQ